MSKVITLFVLWSLSCCGNAWNAMGHHLVAQIAYDNLTPEAKQMCDTYNKAINKVYRSGNFVFAASWLDTIRKKDVHWYDTLHYIDIPYSTEDITLPSVPEINALSAIKQSLVVLKSNKSSLADKGLSLRILSHVVGDIHQPLHTIARVSNKNPKGDLGGNLFPLARNPMGINLHQYWDNGGGVLVGQAKSFQIQNKAKQLEQKWSCTQANSLKNPEQWVRSSNAIARTSAYSLNPHSIPSKRYQLNTQNISQKQILLAGCRLATLLNDVAKVSSHQNA